jgi:hypothetical protein
MLSPFFRAASTSHTLRGYRRLFYRLGRVPAILLTPVT